MAVGKVIEITAVSPESFEAAIADGIHRASKTVENIKSAWVKEQYVEIVEGKIVGFRVTLKVTFLLDKD